MSPNARAWASDAFALMALAAILAAAWCAGALA